MILKKYMQKEDCWSSVTKKELCIVNTWLYNANKSKITFSAGGCEIVIDFMLVGEKFR